MKATGGGDTLRKARRFEAATIVPMCKQKRAPEGALEVKHGKNVYGQAVQVVGPDTTHTGPPTTVLR